MTRLASFSSAGAVLLAAALSLGTARAADPVDIQTESVSLAGLDLSSASGQASARHRIAAAVTRACDQPDLRDLRAQNRFDDCRERATALAVADLEQRVAGVGSAGPMAPLADARR